MLVLEHERPGSFGRVLRTLVTTIVMTLAMTSVTTSVTTSVVMLVMTIVMTIVMIIVTTAGTMAAGLTVPVACCRRGRDRHRGYPCGSSACPWTFGAGQDRVERMPGRGLHAAEQAHCAARCPIGRRRLYCAESMRRACFGPRPGCCWNRA